MDFGVNKTPVEVIKEGAFGRTSQQARNVPGTSSEGSLKVLTSGTSHLSHLYHLHIYLCFLLQKQIFKRSKRGRPRDVYGTQLRDVPGTK